MRIIPGTDERGLIYGLTDSGLSCGRSVIDVVSAMLAGGIRVIQYREKHQDKGIMLEECMALRMLCDEAQACFIVNDHVDLAMLCRADGVHVGQSDLPVREVRRLVGDSMFIGVSTHTIDDVKRAVDDGADCIGIGPIFTTSTKIEAGEGIQYATLDWCASHQPLPFCAIGGIKRSNIAEVAAHGCRSFAVISELVGAPDIAVRAHELAALAKQGLCFRG